MIRVGCYCSSALIGLAILVSLLAHGLVLFTGWCWPASARTAGASMAAVDTRANIREIQCQVFLLEETRSLPAAVVTAPPSIPEAKIVYPDPPPPNAEPPAGIVPTVEGSRPLAGNPPAAGGRASSGQGGVSTGSASAATSFFDVPAQGQSVVYVIDRSSSMGLQGRLATARRELLASLERLPESARFQVIVYNRHAVALRINGRFELVPATRELKNRATDFLAGVAAEGSTDHAVALDRALCLEPDVIYFLTDADDLDASQVRNVTLRNRHRSAIHTIELNTYNRNRPDMPLQILARSNRGTYLGVSLAQPPLQSVSWPRP